MTVVRRRTWGPTRLARGSRPPEDASREWISGAVRVRFPRLAAAIGDARFEVMLATYLDRVPGAQQGLRDSGRKFTDFLVRCPDYPLWYAELATLDRAHVDVLHAPVVVPLARRALTAETELRLVPAHQIVQLTTASDDLWRTLDPRGAAGEPRERTATEPPRALDWPRTVLVWRTGSLAISDRTVAPDEAAALRAAARGTSLVELAAGFPGVNPHARVLDLALRWIDDGAIACVAPA